MLKEEEDALRRVAAWNEESRPRGRRIENELTRTGEDEGDDFRDEAQFVDITYTPPLGFGIIGVMPT
jgi:hypothetical protein